MQFIEKCLVIFVAPIFVYRFILLSVKWMGNQSVKQIEDGLNSNDDQQIEASCQDLKVRGIVCEELFFYCQFFFHPHSIFLAMLGLEKLLLWKRRSFTQLNQLCFILSKYFFTFFPLLFLVVKIETDTVIILSVTHPTNLSCFFMLMFCISPCFVFVVPWIMV